MNVVDAIRADDPRVVVEWSKWCDCRGTKSKELARIVRFLGQSYLYLPPTRVRFSRTGKRARQHPRAKMLTVRIDPTLPPCSDCGKRHQEFSEVQTCPDCERGILFTWGPLGHVGVTPTDQKMTVFSAFREPGDDGPMRVGDQIISYPMDGLPAATPARRGVMFLPLGVGVKGTVQP
ncbi:hypothetical protein [Parenemella sanctibonifatiensis]|uniref:Uncharacterized protein n=1 Tax=Parenemella sanctibonifatiensis TaxID=2016505 RepID=A0A255ECL9_9ACTN|nr:hypothetical protein [Parenemella sanctibonifatiensis]OYN89286.1 hypothetical protein CGZ92_02925 [Parenemella sanctibonifatiensis]